MVPYFGLHSAKMFIKGKPVRFGYKVWIMASKTGYIYSFKVYTGKGEIQNNELGLGANVVLNVINEITEKKHINVFFDNFFSSYCLFKKLIELNIQATGTIRSNRTNKCPLTPANQFKKKPRGHFEEFEDDNGIVCVQWNDTTRPVILMSSSCSN